MKKWANLRDSFMQYKRQYDLRRASGAAATDEPNWKWWRHFDWYLDFNRKRRFALCLISFQFLIIHEVYLIC